jgi:dihydroxyacetone kinase-like protein
MPLGGPGRALGDAEELDGPQLAGAFEAALEGIVELGAAQEGDKTMVDTLAPAIRALRAGVDQGSPVAEALSSALVAGEEGMKSTVPLQAQKGRASYLGERSIGHQDPGATSSALILAALEQTVAAEK